ncbi:MAG: tetratricopeptide repeat protein [Gemmatimonadota bacterium]
MDESIRELLRRRVPHVVGIYLAAAWGLLEFTDWAVTRYRLQAPLITWEFVVLGLLLPLIAWAAWRVGGSAAEVFAPAEAPPRSVAVLPFVGVGGEGDPETEHLGFGIADQILTDLCRVGDLRVVARTSSFAYRGVPDDVRVIGRKLGARAVLEGSVQRSGDRLRVTTQLVSAEDGYHLWSERYDRTIEDVFQIQDEISSNVARVLNAVLREHERKAMARVPTQEIEAYEFYLRGRRFLFQTRRKSLEYARGMFQRAIDIDPGFALAYAGIADVAALLGMYYPAARTDLEAAREASERALELEPDLAEAHAAHGAVLFVSGQLPESEAAFERAVELDPRLFEARYFHARACFQQGRFEDAADLFREASKVREDYAAAFFVGQSLEALGRHPEARAAYEGALTVSERHLDLNPDDPRAATMRAVSLCRLGRVKQGLEWADRALTMDPEDAGVRYNAACLFSVAGKVDRALECLESAMAVGFGNREWLTRDPDLDAVRPDPRFRRLMQRLEANPSSVG